MNCSIPSFPVLYYLLEFAKTHVHWASEAIQPSHLLLLPLTPLVFYLSQHQSLFQWISSVASGGQSTGALDRSLDIFFLQRNGQLCFELRVRVGPCAEPLLQRSRKAICIVCVWSYKLESWGTTNFCNHQWQNLSSHEILTKSTT